MEFVEMLKVDEKFLYSLLTLSQEQSIKTGRFAMIYADEVIVAHQRERVHRVRRQPEIGSAPGPHHPRQGALQPARLAGRAHLRQAAAPVEGAAQRPPRAEHVEGRRDVRRDDAARRTEAAERRHREEDEALRRRGCRGLQVEGRARAEGRDRPRRHGRHLAALHHQSLSSALVRDGVTCINPIDALRAIKDGFEQHTGISASSASAI